MFSRTNSPSPASWGLALQLLALSLGFGALALIASPAVAQEAPAGKRFSSPTPDGGHKDVYTDGKGKVVRTDYFEQQRDGSDRLIRSEEITSFNPDGSAAVKRTVNYDWEHDKRTSETVTQVEKGKAISMKYCFNPIGAKEPYARHDEKTGWAFRDPKSGDWVVVPDSKGEKEPEARYTPGTGWEIHDPKTGKWAPLEKPKAPAGKVPAGSSAAPRGSSTGSSVSCSAGGSLWELRGDCAGELGPQSMVSPQTDGFIVRLTLSPKFSFSSGNRRLYFDWRDIRGYHGIKLDILQGQFRPEDSPNYWVLYQHMSTVRATFNVNGTQTTVEAQRQDSSPARQTIDIPAGATRLESIEVDAFGETLKWSIKALTWAPVAPSLGEGARSE